MQEEKYGTRDRTYSAWHRRLSTRRFVGIDRAQLLAMIDLDASLYIEYDDRTKEPVALIETARDVGQDYKPVTVTRRCEFAPACLATCCCTKARRHRIPLIRGGGISPSSG